MVGLQVKNGLDNWWQSNKLLLWCMLCVYSKVFCLCVVTEIGALDSLPSSVTSDELANP